MTVERAIGHIAGIAPGAFLSRRRDVFDRGLHSDLRRGISKLKDADGALVSDAIVLNGGYEDDDDDWHEIRYTGASADAEKDPKTNQLLVSQSWGYPDNAALKLSYDRKYPIRILRGYNGDKRYSPKGGYRYDGLYRISAVATAISRMSGPDGEPIEICQFTLERCQESEQGLTAAEKAVVELVEFGGEEKFPQSRTVQVQRLIRDTAAARRVRDLYDGQCQTCGMRIVGANSKPHSQGAHLKPLAEPHKGPDVERNILCLCPNCHLRLDIGAISIGEDWSVIERVPQAEVRTTLPRLVLKKRHGLHQAYAQYQREWWDRFERD